MGEWGGGGAGGVGGEEEGFDQRTNKTNNYKSENKIKKTLKYFLKTPSGKKKQKQKIQAMRILYTESCVQLGNKSFKHNFKKPISLA